MLHRLVTLSASIAALGAITTFSTPARADDCTSQWQKLGNAFKTVAPYVVKQLCKELAEGDQAAAEKCVAEYEEKKQEIEAVVKAYNEDAGSGKVGPRGLGWDRWYSGNLKVERIFIGEQVMSDTADFTFEGTGGKGKAPYTVTVCWVDGEGDAVLKPVSKTFDDNNGTWKKSFEGVVGMRPIVYLENSKPSTKGHRYRLEMGIGDEPDFITQARIVAEGKTKRRPKR